ncbi:DUF3127 domain-containing protein [Fodinibius sediminis]|uniref:DUF3127 domain-containing protein n=1 Tax=Fodinibius sediminis TaxID=1214077 RepID=A0A521E4X7_9BACT|nr:DUF3127 domain-containing protein [Fodinibius sediminis]SMO78925.1 protein of unknown function [Fodinibius sediminis]
MDLQIKGTVKKILEEQSGTGKNGPWRKRDFILETGGQYPKKVCITQWGDQIDQANVEEGEELVAHIDIQSREYKGNWYTDVKAWKIEKGAGAQTGSPNSDIPFNDEEPTIDLSETDDDIPF